jgi:cytochrome b561
MTSLSDTRIMPAYNTTAKWLHWLIVALLIAQFIIAWTLPHMRRDTQPDTLINLHFSIGMVILLVAIVRLGWRLFHGEPERGADLPAWQVQTAHVVHWSLYALLLVVPLLGWINASWRGFSVNMFGLEFPRLIETHATGWGWTGDVHGLLANYVMLALVGLHVAAGLYHYFIRRDGVLKRMLPGA